MRKQKCKQVWLWQPLALSSLCHTGHVECNSCTVAGNQWVARAKAQLPGVVLCHAGKPKGPKGQNARWIFWTAWSCTDFVFSKKLCARYQPRFALPETWTGHDVLIQMHSACLSNCNLAACLAYSSVMKQTKNLGLPQANSQFAFRDEYLKGYLKGNR